MGAPLGWATSPEGKLGWDGYAGMTPVQGPVLPPKGWVNVPGPEKIAAALVITYWICPFCKADLDVWGEGAIDSWMECGQCGEWAFLQFNPDPFPWAA